jgi:hypothetical protein
LQKGSPSYSEPLAREPNLKLALFQAQRTTLNVSNIFVQKCSEENLVDIGVPAENRPTRLNSLGAFSPLLHNAP